MEVAQELEAGRLYRLSVRRTALLQDGAGVWYRDQVWTEPELARYVGPGTSHLGLLLHKGFGRAQLAQHPVAEIRVWEYAAGRLDGQLVVTIPAESRVGPVEEA